MKKKLLFWLVSLLTVSVASAQMANPVKVQSQLKEVSATEAEIVFSASIEAGWHMYSTEVVEFGPTPTTLTVEKISGAKLKGKLAPKAAPIKHYEEMFEADVFYFEHTATFVQKLTLEGGKYHVEGFLEYGACNDQSCTPPTKVDFSYDGEAKKEEPSQTVTSQDPSPVLPEEKGAEENDTDSFPNGDENGVADSVSASPTDFSAEADLWTPVVDKLKAFEEKTTSNSSLWQIFLLGLLGGLVALVTPCVWPIIPMTVSFFLKRSGDKKKGIRDAIIYGVSIVVIYLALGLIVTALFGASALNALSTNAIFNIFFFLMLVVFAASFFGAFELQLPSSWSNAVDNKAEKTGGLLGIFLMAFTLTLVSFSCTGPIIGFLLVEVSTSGDILSPAIGMLGFAIALALPFTIFAIFPSWLKSMPKSGGWMNTVKVVLGFVELAFALKFLSVADLAYGWHILDRETFLALWIGLAICMAMYLFGLIKFPHDDADERNISVTRFFLGLISLAFAIYMIPGLWGAPLKAVSAFAPPMSTQDFNLQSQEVKARSNDYDLGMQMARANDKPVLIDFTGFGCVNCRKMEAAVWTDPQVASIMTNDYVLIQLFVDDKTPLPAPIIVNVNGQEQKLRTVGDKWSYLQSSKFGANAQPFYVLLDHQGNPLSQSYAFDDNIDHYLNFLKNGLEQFRKAQKTPLIELGMTLDAAVELNGNKKEMHVKAGETE
ncbi:MAG: thioredoxin family protein [Bacteroidaceae bacterium]|nr:thioredoxin family protein [Bacteroidaceae bacterium]